MVLHGDNSRVEVYEGNPVEIVDINCNLVSPDKVSKLTIEDVAIIASAIALPGGRRDHSEDTQIKSAV